MHYDCNGRFVPHVSGMLCFVYGGSFGFISYTFYINYFILYYLFVVFHSPQSEDRLAIAAFLLGLVRFYLLVVSIGFFFFG